MACKGKLNDDLIYFGETLDRGKLDGASKAFDDANHVLVLGSSLQVVPARNLISRVPTRTVVGLQTNIIDDGSLKISR